VAAGGAGPSRERKFVALRLRFKQTDIEAFQGSRLVAAQEEAALSPEPFPAHSRTESEPSREVIVKRKVWRVLAVGWLLSAGAANAQAARSPADKWADMRGVTVMAGGGVEGFTGSLAPRIRMGPSWAGVIVFKPTSVLGIELGYQGSYQTFNPARLVGYDPALGAGLQRHGGHAALSLGITATRVQPYLHAGVGIARYLVSSGAVAGGYLSMTNGFIPVGVGLRTYFPRGFTLDLRATYNFDFGRSFSPNVAEVEGLGLNAVGSSGRWQGLLYAGYTF
jgi:hypothetical protein